jgi:hypothetical protein
MTNEEQVAMEEKIAGCLVRGGALVRSDAVMLAHDIAIELLADYRIDPHPCGDSYGAAIEEIAKQIQGVRSDLEEFVLNKQEFVGQSHTMLFVDEKNDAHLEFVLNKPKSTDDPMGVVK